MHVVFDDKRIQGFEDEGNNNALQFENEISGEPQLKVMKKKKSQKSKYQLILQHQWIFHIHLWIIYQLIRNTLTDNVSTDNPAAFNSKFFKKHNKFRGSFSKSKININSRKFCQ